ncbi:MAG: bifunctional riboflavin kinase/FAD synthetase [Nitrospirales bacterium]
MKVTRSLTHHHVTTYPVLTIGNFDGLHRGHQALLKSVVQAAIDKSGTASVLTFDPHPITVLSPGTPLRLLTTMEDKLARFEEAGIEHVFCLPFNKAFAALTPEEFVFKMLRDQIGVRELLVGEQFAFGAGRSGRMADLVRLSQSAGFVVHAVPPIRVEDEIVSSTRIRVMIQAGEVGRAARFLGRSYDLAGTVVRGAQRGQTLGWPTANIRLPHHRVIPADGVYATTAVCNGRSVNSVVYIGTRPTFGDGERLVEVYLLDEQLDLYGKDIFVRFVERLRGDQVFPTPEDLSRQIDVDVLRARDVLKAAAKPVVDSQVS